MYTEHWGLSKSPFTGPSAGSSFHPNAGQSEAIARIEYLIENHRRIGLLVGETGFGKTTLFNHIATQASRGGGVSITISLLGLDKEQFVVSLAEQLGDYTLANATPAIQWRGIYDQLTTNEYQQRSTVLLLDDAQEANREVITVIERLSQWNPAHNTRVTILLASTPGGIPMIGRRLLEQCELRISLQAWSLQDTINHVRKAIAQTGAASSIFDDDALQLLHERSAGNPRRLRQLAELALVASAGQGMKRIGEELLRAVDTELRMPIPPAAA